MPTFTFVSVIAIAAALAGYGLAATCKCVPSDPCWPTPDAWAALNSSVSGKLIANTPLAAPCYPGPSYDPTACANVQANWYSYSFRAQFPIGYDFADVEYCGLPWMGSSVACSLGNSPVYAVDAHTADDVVAAVNFARTKNIRLVIKATGHDYLSRSTGFGSLEVWLRNLRTGLAAEPSYQPTQPCLAARGGLLPWTGSAMSISAGYSWSDVYPVARASNLIVVGAACADVGSIGGYLLGGGHSPASSQFGLAADQLLEATVVLADGSQVVASACQNSALFKALRGGGGGTYGIVTSAKVKAYPEMAVAAVTLTMYPLTANDIPLFIQSLTYLYEYFPLLISQGLGGYAGWTLYDPNPVLGIIGSPGLFLVLAGFGFLPGQVEALFEPVIGGLAPLNGTSLGISVSYTVHATYSDYYYTMFGGRSTPPPGGVALSSRLLGLSHLAPSNAAALQQLLNVSAGTPDQQTSVVAALVGGRAVAQAPPDGSSGVNPAWRQAYMAHVVVRAWANNATTPEQAQAARADLTNVRGAAAVALAPDTGSYMNEGDDQDPNYQLDFYGAALPALQSVKAAYDPDGVFYCPTCVGSEHWTGDSFGRLCKA